MVSDQFVTLALLLHCLTEHFIYGLRSVTEHAKYCLRGLTEHFKKGREHSPTRALWLGFLAKSATNRVITTTNRISTVFFTNFRTPPEGIIQESSATRVTNCLGDKVSLG